MTRGRWVLVAIFVVAAAMGLASWPLLTLRRKNETHRTKVLLRQLFVACWEFRDKHRSLPRPLSLVTPSGQEPLDAWGRPITLGPGRRILLRSLGPNPNDEADDLFEVEIPGQEVP